MTSFGICVLSDIISSTHRERRTVPGQTPHGISFLFHISTADKYTGYYPGYLSRNITNIPRDGDSSECPSASRGRYLRTLRVTRLTEERFAIEFKHDERLLLNFYLILCSRRLRPSTKYRVVRRGWKNEFDILCTG